MSAARNLVVDSHQSLAWQALMRKLVKPSISLNPGSELHFQCSVHANHGSPQFLYGRLPDMDRKADMTSVFRS